MRSKPRLAASIALHLFLVGVSCSAFVWLTASTVEVPVRDAASERLAARAVAQRDLVISVLQADVKRLRAQLQNREVAAGGRQDPHPR